MPIYEYRCDQCGHEFETIQRVSEDRLRTCPACGREALRKKVSAAAFRLKGGGWYETDFKGDKRRNVAGESKDTDKPAKEGGDKSGAGDTGGKSGESAAKSGETTKSGGETSRSGGDKTAGGTSKGE